MNRWARLLCIAIAVSLLSAIATSGSAQSAAQSAVNAISGADVYKQRCASCHDQVDARIPTRVALEKLSPARILKTLDFGAMMSIAYPLRRDEREAVAMFLGHGASDPPPPQRPSAGRTFASCATRQRPGAVGVQRRPTPGTSRRQ